MRLAPDTFWTNPHPEKAKEIIVIRMFFLMSWPGILLRNIKYEKVWRTKKFDSLLRYLTPFSARILELSWRKSAASYQTLGWWPRQRRHCSKANMTRLAIKRGSSTFNGFDFSHEMYFCQRSIWKQECRCNETRSNSKNIGQGLLAKESMNAAYGVPILTSNKCIQLGEGTPGWKSGYWFKVWVKFFFNVRFRTREIFKDNNDLFYLSHFISSSGRRNAWCQFVQTSSGNLIFFGDPSCGHVISAPFCKLIQLISRNGTN